MKAKKVSANLKTRIFKGIIIIFWIAVFLMIFIIFRSDGNSRTIYHMHQFSNNNIFYSKNSSAESISITVSPFSLPLNNIIIYFDENANKKSSNTSNTSVLTMIMNSENGRNWTYHSVISEDSLINEDYGRQLSLRNFATSFAGNIDPIGLGDIIGINITIEGDQRIHKIVIKNNDLPFVLLPAKFDVYTNKSQNFYLGEFNKTEGTYRIGVLGDSMVAASSLDANEKFTFLLEENLNRYKMILSSRNISRVEVLNFGRNSANAEDEYDILKDEAIKYNLDSLIIVFYRNDCENYTYVKRIMEELRNSSEYNAMYAQEMNETARLLIKFDALHRAYSETEFLNYYRVCGTVSDAYKNIHDLTKDNMSVSIIMWYESEYQKKLINNISLEYDWPLLDLIGLDKMYGENKIWIVPGEDSHGSAFAHRIIANRTTNFILTNYFYEKR